MGSKLKIKPKIKIVAYMIISIIIISSISHANEDNNSIPKLSKLSTLKLDSNIKFNSKIIKDLSELTNIKNIDIKINSISGNEIDVRRLKNIKYLETLILDFSNVNMKRIIGNNTKIREKSLKVDDKVVELGGGTKSSENIPNLSEYSKIIYVDGATGDDTNGDGTESNPYKTINFSSTEFNNTDAIFIKGTVGMTGRISYALDVDIIGDYAKYRSRINGSMKGTVNTGTLTYTYSKLDIYGTYIYQGSHFSSSRVFENIDINTYNCIIQEMGNYGNSAVIGNHYETKFVSKISTNNGYFENCLFSQPEVIESNIKNSRFGLTFDENFEVAN